MGTTAVISATASPETCSGQNLQAAKFIIDNYDQLVEETARGEGEHLVSVLAIMDCGAAGAATAVPGLRQQVGRGVIASDYVSSDLEAKASGYYSALVSASDHCAA